MADSKVIYELVMTKTSWIFHSPTGCSHYVPVKLGHDIQHNYESIKTQEYFSMTAEILSLITKQRQ